MTIRSFLCSPPSYVATSPWRAWAALLATGLTVAAGQVFAAIALHPVFGVQPDDLRGLWPAGHEAVPLDAAAHRGLMALVVLSQVALVAVTLALARYGGWGPVLKLQRPAGGWPQIASAIACMLPVVTISTLAATILAPDQVVQDLKAFSQVAKGPSVVLTGMAIGLGASLSEELLFRGFLLSALARTALGYWPSAVLAALVWTLLHAGSHSWVSLLQVFLFGLYFSWLLWQTGSLWPALICHAVYNSSLLAILRFWPE